MFEVANLEESDIVLKSAKVGVCDVWDHDDVEVTEAVVIDSVYIVASSHLTENVALEVPPTAAYKEAIGEACHSDIGPRYGRAVFFKNSLGSDLFLIGESSFVCTLRLMLMLVIANSCCTYQRWLDNLNFTESVINFQRSSASHKPK